jgi:hypothetical protein
MMIPVKKIFVFGSNEGGRHGAGSALAAVQKYGAIYGQGWHRQGDAFAIPTKDADFKVLSIDKIQYYVNQFIKYAKDNSRLTFEVVKIGCGLAGFKEEQISPLFKEAPENCLLPDGWRS